MQYLDSSFLRALCSIDTFLGQQHLDYCIVGGLAVCFRGEVRATVDIDISVKVDLGSEKKLIELLLSEFSARYPDSKSFAEEHKVLFLEIQGISVDVLLGFSALDEASISNATKEPFGGDLWFPVCSAEDLIIHKCLANSEQDRADVQSILQRSVSEVCIENIERVLAEAQEVIDDRDLLGEWRAQLSRCLEIK